MARFDNVMIVDSDTVSNFISESFLIKNNIARTVKFFLNGKKAIEYLKSELNLGNSLPEIILVDIDIKIPVINRWEFLQKFNELRFHDKDKILLVALTNSDLSEDAEKLHRLNCHIILPKPIYKRFFEKIIS